MRAFQNPDYSLRQLQYAVAVAETGGFGTAADVCGVSQPSLSAQVAKLEEALGVQLFERHARGVQVTRAGDALIARMRVVLADSRALEDAACALKDPYSVTLRVGVIPTVAPYLLPEVVERLRARERAPTVYWLEMQTAVCEAALVDGKLDAMIIADPPEHPSLDAVELGFEPFEVVLPVDHALRGAVGVEDVSANEVLLLEDGHCLRDQALSLCLQPGAQESPFRATSLPTLVQMVSAGLGISVLPASAVPVELPRARVRVEHFRTPTVGRTLRMGWRSRSPHTTLLRELAGVVREALAAVLEEARRAEAG